MPQAFDIAFLGGGQLARMSIQAAQRMGLKCLSLDPGQNTPASQIASSIVGPLDSPDHIAEVFRQASRVTLENEFIPADRVARGVELAGVSASVLVPGIDCLATIQDKLLQRQALAARGVPSPRAVALSEGDTHDDTYESLSALGAPEKPVVLKARFGGYDGKGTRYARNREEFFALAGDWAGGGWLAEEFMPFDRELAVMVYRSPTDCGTFPTMETIQTNHVCDLVFPCDADASEIAISAVEAVSGFGLFGVELFDVGGRYSVNEIAPRPHNTGHYTLDWGGVSQFEQHVRLTMGWRPEPPVGGPACMANLLGIEGAGNHVGAINAALSVPSTHVHWYGKAESRPGRKMGHINAVGDDCIRAATRSREAFYQAWEAGG